MTCDVLGLWNQLKMVGVNARDPLAAMVDVHAVRDRADIDQVGDAMRQGCPSGDVELRIAGTVDGGSPVQTRPAQALSARERAEGQLRGQAWRGQRKVGR